jgi:phenylacetate-CoA ligase
MSMEILKRTFSKIFYKLISIVSGSGFLSKLEFIKEYEYKDREEIEELQFSLLKSLIKVAYKETPFYRQKYKKSAIKPNALKSIEDLSKFPIVSKREIRNDYELMINKRYNKKKLKHTQSSGSTGEPKTFYFDNEAYGWRLASQFLGWQRSGFSFGDKWMRISMADRKSLFYKIFNFFSRCIYVSLTDFNEEKYEKIQLLLEKERPKMIYSYCSALYVLAEYLDKKGVSYDFIENIVVQGDILFPQYREVIERVFKTKVFDTYGGDGVIVSGQCRKGNYHIQDVGVIVEIVGDNDQTVSEGEVGRVLVTDLHNKAMPLIRYEIADLGTKRLVKCSCGSNFSITGRPIGRDTDIIRLSNGMSLLVEYFVVVFEYYLEILQFQVREVACDELLIYLEVTEKFTKEMKKEILQQIFDYCNGGVKLSIEIVDKIPLERSNKRRLVIAKE